MQPVSRCNAHICRISNPTILKWSDTSCVLKAFSRDLQSWNTVLEFVIVGHSMSFEGVRETIDFIVRIANLINSLYQ
jgi:hypothetical protein